METELIVGGEIVWLKDGYNNHGWIVSFGHADGTGIVFAMGMHDGQLHRLRKYGESYQELKTM